MRFVQNKQIAINKPLIGFVSALMIQVLRDFLFDKTKGAKYITDAHTTIKIQGIELFETNLLNNKNKFITFLSSSVLLKKFLTKKKGVDLTNQIDKKLKQLLRGLSHT